MQNPFVRRSAFESVRALLREKRTQLRETRDRALAAEAQVALLRERLERSEAERTEATLRLIKVGFGMHPFEVLQTAQPVPTSPEPSSPVPTGPAHDASPAQVQEFFVREASQLHGHNLARIRDHVQRRMDEFYGNKTAALQRVQQELQDSIREGQHIAMTAQE